MRSGSVSLDIDVHGIVVIDEIHIGDAVSVAVVVVVIVIVVGIVEHDAASHARSHEGVWHTSGSRDRRRRRWARGDAETAKQR